MNDTTPVTETVEVEAPKPNLVQRGVAFATSKTGKTILAVAGTASALFGTYVFGFKQGQDNLIEAARELDREDETDEELDTDETDDTEESDDTDSE